SIASTRIPEKQQDIFIDLIFSPIYFNILIKPETLTDEYIYDMLTTVIRSFIPDESF
ncbi:TetR family transcriptional regulator, partial [Staphylococcus epidermidis]|nr:TetR family transcriptional regulator [Staphylococcus epidermidis]